jgi:5,6-dimethylbenzimidazole synthase
MVPSRLAAVTEHAFSATERQAVYRAITERRDMRKFAPDAVVPEDVLARLLHAAHCAPSVGLMQPWRFIRITDAGLRTRIHALVDEERLRTAEALGPRGDEFLALKVEGILECAELFVVALCDGRQAHVFGRRTLPQMDLASVFWRDPEPVVGRARRRPRDGLGIDLRPRSARRAAGDA